MSDELWAVLEPVLPKHSNTQRFGGGKPRTPDRQCADAIFYVLRTGVSGGPETLRACAHTPQRMLGFSSG